MTTTCRDCHATWTGLNEAHCTGCHRSFGGITGFDLHKVLTGGCLDPATLGMTEVTRVAHTVWVRPGRSNAPWACRGVTQIPDPAEPVSGEGRGPGTPPTALLAFSLPTVATVGAVA